MSDMTVIIAISAVVFVGVIVAIIKMNSEEGK